MRPIAHHRSIGGWRDPFPDAEQFAEPHPEPYPEPYLEPHPVSSLEQRDLLPKFPRLYDLLPEEPLQLSRAVR